MSGVADENRLSGQEGPYVRRLQHDPIHWQPWDDSAFDLARDHDVPIFLSIGDDLSHWCRRMHAESFRDEAVASVLNESFVPIAIDRVTRPAIDITFQTIARAVEDTGGWPLSVWLTPSLEPFYVGTYFPPEHTDYAPGFCPLIELMAERWDRPNFRSDIDERATQWAEYAREDLDLPPAGTIDIEATVMEVASLTVKTADPNHDGWGTGAKAPEPIRLQFLLTAAARGDLTECRDLAISTTNTILESPVFDHVGGGCFEYSAQRDWSDPIVEKRIATNAEMARAFLAAHQVDGDPAFADAARTTFEFIDRTLRSSDGGVIEGVAGTEGMADDPQSYYRWSAGEVDRYVDDSLVQTVLKRRFGIQGNGHAGEIPRVRASIDDIAESLGEPPEEVRRLLAEGCDELLSARERRSTRVRDERVRVGSNGLVIRAFAEGSVVLNDTTLADRAETICGTILDGVWDGTEFSSRFLDDEEWLDSIPAMLDDFAHFGRGVLSCYEVTGNDAYLDDATAIAAQIQRQFWDGERLLLCSDASRNALIVSPQVTADRQHLASIPATIELFAGLGRLRETEDFGQLASDIFEQYAPRIHGDLLAHHGLTLAGDQIRAGTTELKFSSETIPDRWRAWLADRYFPYRLITRKGTRATLEERPSPNGESVVQISVNGIESGQFSSVTQADAWLADLEKR